jgi:glycosyltransferase involved in cell wall biosynthesis
LKIAFVADPRSPNAWYRGIGPMVALMQRGHEVRQVLRLDGDFRAELVAGCDVLHIHRQWDERTLNAVRHAKEAGIAVVWDNDDDMTAVPKGNVGYKEFGGLSGERVRAAVGRLLAWSDLVSTPSALLAERFREQGAQHVLQLENYVRDEVLRMRRVPDGDEVVFGWVAGLEHHLDIERLPIRDAIQRLLDAHPNARFTSIGVGLGIRSERYRHVQSVPFNDLLGQVAELHVGIAPIADMPFNRARSNIKVKEYAALGIPWLASPVGPYAGMGERQGGRLVADGDWYEALERMLVKARERRKLAKRALKWGRAQAISANVGLWERALQDAVARARVAA